MQLPIPKFKVLIYGPGLPSAGVKARAYFEESLLVVQSRAHSYTVQSERLSLGTGGFDGRQWLLSWSTTEGDVRLMLQGDDAVDEFIKLAPPLISKQFGRVRREQTDKSRVLRYSLIIPALIGLLAAMTCLVYWLFAHEVSQWAASKLTAAHREQLGASAFEQVRPSLKLVERGLVRDTVQFVGVRVSSGTSNRYYYHVADSAQINTIFLPGGHLVINTGLLRSLQNTNELAAMLAHAASHEEMRHTLTNLIFALGWRAAFAAVIGDVSSGIWQNMTEQLLTLRFTETQKMEADTAALEMLRRSGVAPDGLIPFLARMAKREVDMLGGDSASASVLQLAHEVRLKALRQALTNRQYSYHHQDLPIEWSEFKRALAN